MEGSQLKMALFHAVQRSSVTNRSCVTCKIPRLRIIHLGWVKD